MRRFCMWCVLLLAATCLSAAAANRKDITAVRVLAEKMVAATLDGDYAFVVDHTYEGLIKEMGGRDEAILFAESSMKKIKQENLVIKSYVASTPADVVAEGANLFAIVPTRLEMIAPNASIVSRNYLLAISTDGGKTWKFVDGSGLEDATVRERVLPKLPVDFKLPESQKPEVLWAK